MNKKSLLGLILFASLVIAGMFFTTVLLIDHSSKTNIGNDKTYIAKEDTKDKTADTDNSKDKTADTDNLKDKTADTDNSKNKTADTDNSKDKTADTDNSKGEPTEAAEITNIIEKATAGFASDTATNSTEPEADVPTNSSNEGSTDTSLTTSANISTKTELIYDCKEVDYKSYIPKMQYDSELEAALNISNPDIGIDAEAAILFDADTKKVLYYKNAVKAVFPASTLKLLSSVVILQWCSEDEKVTIGDEITMIAPDSTWVHLKEGQVLTIRNLLEAMLLPSGNDAAYAAAAYVGRKSLHNEKASKEEAVAEFTRLMNKQAKKLGAKNSCFKTPDGYDAVGQYTTAYDMGLIGIAAASNDTIVAITGKISSRNTFVSGEDVTWDNTNKLINRYSGEYYSPAIGLKTGTSTMAGRCLISAANMNEKKVVCVIMNSSSAGRWEDAIALMKYALN